MFYIISLVSKMMIPDSLVDWKADVFTPDLEHKLYFKTDLGF